ILYRPNNEEDDILSDFRGVMSKAEKKRFARRVREGKAEGLGLGGLVHGEAPYAYRFERYTPPAGSGLKDRPSPERMVTGEEEAEIVRLIYRLGTVGPDPENGPLGTVRIAYYLNDRGTRPPKANLWNSCTVRRILKHGVYKGEWVWGRTNKT